MNIRFIGVSEVEAYMKNEMVQFIDLRDKSDYRQKHIKGALSMPYEIFKESYTSLSKRKIYVLYCDRGATSILAASAMQNSGYRCFSLAGGIMAFDEKL